MIRYFWREKNANAFIGKNTVIAPTREELEQELINKIIQKCGRLSMIFDIEFRNQFFNSDESARGVYLEQFTEEEIRQNISFNVAIDLLQLVYDLSTFYNLDEGEAFRGEYFKNLSIYQIIYVLNDSATNLKKRKYISISINNIYLSVVAICSLYHHELRIIEKKRQERELAQGNYLRGKYVIK